MLSHSGACHQMKHLPREGAGLLFKKNVSKHTHTLTLFIYRRWVFIFSFFFLRWKRCEWTHTIHFFWQIDRQHVRDCVCWYNIYIFLFLLFLCLYSADPQSCSTAAVNITPVYQPSRGGWMPKCWTTGPFSSVTFKGFGAKIPTNRQLEHWTWSKSTYGPMSL